MTRALPGAESAFDAHSARSGSGPTGPGADRGGDEADRPRRAVRRLLRRGDGSRDDAVARRRHRPRPAVRRVPADLGPRVPRARLPQVRRHPRERAPRRRYARRDRWAAGALRPLARPSMRPSAFGSEVRAVFAADGSAWGIGQFNRLSDSPRYSEDEKAGSNASAPLFGAALRQALLTEPAESPADRGPGIVVLDAEGGAVSATSEATRLVRGDRPQNVGDAVRGDHVRGTRPRVSRRRDATRPSLAPASARGRASGSPCTRRCWRARTSSPW